MKRNMITTLLCCNIILLCACGKDTSDTKNISVPVQDESNAVNSPNEADKMENADRKQDADAAQFNEETQGVDIAQSDEKTQNTLGNSAEKERESESENEADKDEEIEAWKRAYLTYLDTREDADGCTYSLIYVDDDDIPELMIDTGYEAGGCQILTYHDGVLDEWQSCRLNVTYIERGNLICNSDGNMGYYYDNVYTIQDGKWNYVDGGTYGDGPDGVQFDEDGALIVVYNWSGEDVSCLEEYEARQDRVYPTEQERYPERYYIEMEMRSLLKTGDVSSAGHRYEFVVEDLTWNEAEAACREKGGYLAAITSWEEMERIEEQMISEHKMDITFFVGAKNPRRKDDSVWGYHWIEPENGKLYDMLDLHSALDGFWLEGEPSYRGEVNGVSVDEDYVVLLYRKADKRCYINDVPDDIIAAAPFYAGKVGYICEYDE